MYVCMCNCVTDRQLVEAAAELAREPGKEGVSSFAERVADRFGAGLGCGTCRTFAVALVERAAAEQTAVVLSAHVPGSVELVTPPDSLGDGGIEIAPAWESGRSGDPLSETRT